MKKKHYITPIVKVCPVVIDPVNFVTVSISEDGNNENGPSAKFLDTDFDSFYEETDKLW